MEDQQKSEIVSSLRVRASRFRQVAFVALGVSVALLIIAIYLFLYASELSFKDSVNLLELKSIQIEQLNKQRTELNIELTKAQERYLSEIKGAGPTGLAGMGPVSKQLQERMQYLEYQLKSMDEKLASEQSALSNGNRNEISMSQVITTSITRFIVLGTVIFLVQILINLYKYNMRVAGHYEAIADALALSEKPIEAESFSDIAELISPNKIDFGTTPSSIFNQAIELSKAVNQK